MARTTSTDTGSIGGTTYQKNSSGSIARQRTTGRKFATQKQAIARQTQNKFLYMWQGLTITEKTSWNDYATLYTKINKYGLTKKLTGWNWFESTNYNLILAGMTPITTAPTHTIPTSVPIFTLTITSTSITIDFSPTFNPTNQSLIINSTPPITTTSKAINNKSIFTKIKQGGNYSSINIISEWETTHGLILNDIYSVGGFNIAIQIQTLEQTSGIASPAMTIINVTT